MSESAPPQSTENVCAHEPCSCTVSVDRKYCSEVCAELHSDGQSSEACGCSCPHCEGNSSTAS